MSVENLLISLPDATELELSMDEDKIRLELCNLDAYIDVRLDRSQAHMLFLYLQDHLKP